MLIRFTVLEKDADTGRNCGILVAAHTLRDNGDLSSAEHDGLRLALLWFNENLPIPTVLDDMKNRRAISWFKPAAQESIRRMWQLKQILDVHGLHVEVVRTTEPGAIVYQDDLQVIAKPPKRRS